MQKITLNIVPNGICPRVYVNQYDLGRQFQISFNEGAQVYNFPNGATFKINGRKADNHVYEYTEADTWDGTNPVISKSGSGTSLVVTIATTEQMTAAPGEAKVQLTYKISNAVTGTLNFIMVVQERPEASGDPSESDVPDVVRSVNGVTPDADGDVVVPGSGTAVTKNFASLEASRTMTATRNIGDFVYISSEDQLYEITATISSGGTLIPNTNATAVTVGDVLQMLNSELTPQSFSLTIDTAHFSMPSYRAIKMGKFVEIAGDIAVTDNSYKTSNNFSQCFNIPEVSKAPSVATVFNIIDTTNDKPLNGTITTDGKVYVNRDYTTSCSNLRFHALYIVS